MMLLLFSLDNQKNVTFGSIDQTIQGYHLDRWIKPLLLLGMDRFSFTHDTKLDRTVLTCERDFPPPITHQFEIDYDLGKPLEFREVDFIRVFVTMIMALIEWSKDKDLIIHSPIRGMEGLMAPEGEA